MSLAGAAAIDSLSAGAGPTRSPAVKMRLLALVCLSLVALAAAQKDKEKPKPTVYKTPQEVFDAAEKAWAKSDWKAYFACYTPRLQRELAAGGAEQICQGRAQLLAKDDEKSKKSLKEGKPILDVLDKHGLTARAFDKIAKDAGKDEEKARKALLALVKDHAAFLADLAEAVTKLTGKSRVEDEKKLTDVKIDGDKATGAVTTTTTIQAKGEEDRKFVNKSTMAFAKVNGGWLIDDYDKPKKDKGPPYKTPQDVFDAAEEARAKSDWKTFLHCHTPRMQRDFAAESAYQFGQRRAELLAKDDDEKVKDALKENKPVFDVLDKHGLTAKAFDKIVKDAGKDEEKAKKAILALIEDDLAFTAEALAALDKTAFSPSKLEGRKLTDVKIDGDKATGATVGVLSKKEQQSVTFSYVKGGWRIDKQDRQEKKEKDKGKK
jgi:histone H3/H4